MTKKIKTPKIERRATEEINIVKSCRKAYGYKLDDVNTKVREIEARLQVLLEKGKLSTDENERREIAREIKKIRDNLSMTASDKTYFQETVDLFDKLISTLDSLAMREQYRLIVRKIPEKKLPEFVRDMDKRDKLNELLLSLISVLDTANKKAMQSSKRLSQKMHTREIENQIFAERNAPDESDLEKIMAEFGEITETVVVENPNNNANKVTE